MSRIFLFFLKRSFLCTFWEIRLNEQKIRFYFFWAVFFFPVFEIEWMNNSWTFPGKEKKHRKRPQNLGKDKIQFIKIIAFLLYFDCWLMNFSWGIKKTCVCFLCGFSHHRCRLFLSCKSSYFTHIWIKLIEWLKMQYFFSGATEKKNTKLRSIEWVTHELLQEQQ